jgi:A/G-specific adenine glycosylase
MADFQLLITNWYKQNKRALPWRNTTDAYKIWLSEIILQQTRVDQGLSYYIKFLDHYPTITDLADASEQDVLKLWQGLGYYSRARNLHATANTVKTQFNGKFPSEYKNIIQLKGIGAYTAAAIASFAYNLPIAVLDGNVYRVLSRVFDIDLPIDSTQGKKEFALLAQSLINSHDPATYNQGIMEFGALQCTPLKPDCETCPLESQCLALSRKTIFQRPVKQQKIIIKKRFLHYLIYHFEEETYIQQRTTKDIWQNLYEFPLIETDENVTLNFSDSELNALSFVSDEVKHILSHQHLITRFYHFNCKPSTIHNNWIKIKQIDIQNYPLPRLIDRYLNAI